MRNSIISSLVISACVLILSGCGQKGPLFVPEDPEAQNAEAALEQINEETQKKKNQAAE